MGTILVFLYWWSPAFLRFQYSTQFFFQLSNIYLLPNGRPVYCRKKGLQEGPAALIKCAPRQCGDVVIIIPVTRRLPGNFYALISSTSSSTSTNLKASLVHHLTQDGSGGSPHKSHFKGISVPGSKKNGFSGHAARHSAHVS
jgi:hypothetical protein